MSTIHGSSINVGPKGGINSERLFLQVEMAMCNGSSTILLLPVEKSRDWSLIFASSLFNFVVKFLFIVEADFFQVFKAFSMIMYIGEWVFASR